MLNFSERKKTKWREEIKRNIAQMDEGIDYSKYIKNGRRIKERFGKTL